MPLPNQGQSHKVWTIFVDDNFHCWDESEHFDLGKFERYEVALA
ncbi:hypothetical protein [Nordella sp. HKS 07]|nr:hypothetical protein [Nordella sp. HKS 07]